MSGFTKLVPEIIQSSIWNEPAEIRIVWITLIATKDENGYVRGDSRTIARMANVDIKAAENALEKFQQADPSSHTPDNDGRRIAKAPGGWIVLNHELYRTGDRTAYMRDYMREYRAKQPVNNDVNNVSVNVSSPSVSVSLSDSVSSTLKNKEQLLKQRLNALYGRRESTRWSVKEERRFIELYKNESFESEISEIEQYFVARDKDGTSQYLRHDMATLLNNWSGELDRARTFKPEAEKHNGKSSFQEREMERKRKLREVARQCGRENEQRLE